VNDVAFEQSKSVTQGALSLSHLALYTHLSLNHTKAFLQFLQRRACESGLKIHSFDRLPRTVKKIQCYAHTRSGVTTVLLKGKTICKMNGLVEAIW